MNYTIHQVPGRLRVNIPSLRRNEAMKKRAKKCLAECRGILSSRVSVLTGSIVMYYDVSATGAERLFDQLHESGLVASPAVSGHGIRERRFLAEGPLFILNLLLALLIKGLIDKLAQTLIVDAIL